MRIQVLSDLHLEFRDPRSDDEFFDSLVPPEERRPDILLLAGDAANWADSARTAEVLAQLSKRWKDVIWVAGNHEYYGLDNPRHALGGNPASWCKVPSNVEMVDWPRAITVGNQRFLCGTMWYSYEGVEATGYVDPLNGCFLKNGRMVQFSDFHQIGRFAGWVYDMNRVFQDLLRDLKKGDVVVSHHLPLDECVVPMYRSELDNCFYVCDQSAVIEKGLAPLWVHGHTHSDVDLTVNGCRILANPCGYPREREKRGSHWDPFRGIVELP